MEDHGHWEGDVIIGTGRSAIGTIVERKRRSRSILLVHLPRLQGWGQGPRTKNRPTLGGYGAEVMNAALQTSMPRLPLQPRQTLTWDRGTELADQSAAEVIDAWAQGVPPDEFAFSPLPECPSAGRRVFAGLHRRRRGVAAA